MWPRLINIAVGVWLMAAPAALKYDGRAADHDRIVGPLIASIACISIWEATRALRGVNVVIGAWMLLAPWLLSFPTTPTWHTMVCGAAVVGFALVRGRLKHRFDGGWWLATASTTASPDGADRTT